MARLVSPLDAYPYYYIYYYYYYYPTGNIQIQELEVIGIMSAEIADHAVQGLCRACRRPAGAANSLCPFIASTSND